MAEINKLSAGKALDRLRGNVPESKNAQRDKKIDALEEDIQRMRATRLRLERDQQAAEPIERNAQEPNDKKGPRWLVVFAIIVPLLLTSIISMRRWFNERG